MWEDHLVHCVRKMENPVQAESGCICAIRQQLKVHLLLVSTTNQVLFFFLHAKLLRWTHEVVVYYQNDSQSIHIVFEISNPT